MAHFKPARYAQFDPAGLDHFHPKLVVYYVRILHLAGVVARLFPLFDKVEKDLLIDKYIRIFKYSESRCMVTKWYEIYN